MDNIWDLTQKDCINIVNYDNTNILSIRFDDLGLFGIPENGSIVKIRCIINNERKQLLYYVLRIDRIKFCGNLMDSYKAYIYDYEIYRDSWKYLDDDRKKQIYKQLESIIC